MAQDNLRLNRFLYDKGIPPDDFQYFREHVINDDIAVIETESSDSFFFDNDRGPKTHKLVSRVIGLCLSQVDFSVSFLRPDAADDNRPDAVASEGQYLQDLNENALIKVHWEDRGFDDDPEVVYYRYDDVPLEIDDRISPSASVRYPKLF